MPTPLADGTQPGSLQPSQMMHLEIMASQVSFYLDIKVFLVVWSGIA